MVPVVLKRPEKLKILLKRIGKYITGKDIPPDVGYRRKYKIYQDWISGGKYFYFLMETENIDKHNTLDIFFYPININKWNLLIKQRVTSKYQEKYITLLDFDFMGNEDKCVSAVIKLPIWWKIIDAIDNMCQTRLNQNPKYRTIQHNMAIDGTLDRSTDFLNKFYNPKDKEKYNSWKQTRENKETLLKSKKNDKK